MYLLIIDPAPQPACPPEISESNVKYCLISGNHYEKERERKHVKCCHAMNPLN